MARQPTDPPAQSPREHPAAPEEVTIPAMDRPQDIKDMEMRWGSDAMAALLRAMGLQYVALNPGSSYRGLHDSLVNYLGNEAPHMLVCLHEEHAVAMAHGYAKICGKPMGVILHSNVGLMHGAMAIFNAWCDRVPMFILGATGAVDAARRRPWIEWIHTTKDQGALVRPYLKWDGQPASVPEAIESMLRAHQLTQTAPCGPVYVTLDVSLQEDPLESPLALPDVARYAPAPAPRPRPEDVAQAARWLAGAAHPLMMIGRVNRSQQGWDERVQLAEKLGATVLTDFKQGAAFPLEHPLHGAVPEFRLNEEAQQQVRQADVILSLDWVDLAGTLLPALDGEAPEASIIHCSLDSYSHGGWGMEYMGLPPVDLPMLTPPEVIVPLLLSELDAQQDPELPTRVENRLAALSVSRPVSRSSGTRGNGADSREITTTDIARELFRAREGRELCLIRLPFGWDAAHYPLRGPLDYLGYDGGAGLGSGPGMSVGGALALQGSGRLPIAVLGDGDFLMGVTALWTASHYQLPLLIVIANNHTYNNDVAHQERVALRRERPVHNKFIGQTIDGPPVDLPAMALAQGFSGGKTIAAPAQLAEAMDAAVAAVARGERYLLDVHIRRG